MGPVREVLIEPKTHLWIATRYRYVATPQWVGASVTNTFEPLIQSGLGFDKYLVDHVLLL